MEGEDVEEIQIKEPFLEVTEAFYNNYSNLLPTTFELDNEGNLINIIPLPKPEPETPTPTTDERLQMAEETIMFFINGRNVKWYMDFY